MHLQYTLRLTIPCVRNCYQNQCSSGRHRLYFHLIINNFGLQFGCVILAVANVASNHWLGNRDEERASEGWCILLTRHPQIFFMTSLEAIYLTSQSSPWNRNFFFIYTVLRKTKLHTLMCTNQWSSNKCICTIQNISQITFLGLFTL